MKEGFFLSNKKKAWACVVVTIFLVVILSATLWILGTGTYPYEALWLLPLGFVVGPLIAFFIECARFYRSLAKEEEEELQKKSS